jgi:hypothetical protein
VAGGQYDATTKVWSGGGGTSINGVTYFAHAGSPAGVVVALAIGDVCIDTTNGLLYQATATGSGNWVCETARAETAEALLAPKASPTFTTAVTLPAILNAAALPASDPHVAGHVWSNSGVLTVSAG